MRKVFLLLVASAFAFSASAQKLNIENALKALKENDVAKAKAYIDKAVTTESTKKDGRAWLVRAFIYQAIGTDNLKTKEGGYLPLIANINGRSYAINLNKAKSLRPTTEDPLKNSLKSFNRYLVYSKRPDTKIVMVASNVIMISGYNNGIAFYNKGQYDKAFKSFSLVDRVANLKKGKFVPSLGNSPNEKSFKSTLKEVQNNVLKLKGKALFFQNKNEEALPILEQAMKSPTAADDDTYSMLADIYAKKGDQTKSEAILAEGIKRFPDSKKLAQEEMNMLLKSGDLELVIKKLEDAIAADPKNPINHYNAGVKYKELFDKVDDKKEKEIYFAKATEAFKTAAKLDASQPKYQFNLGALYFNKAKEVGDIMNNTTDNAKYATLKKSYDSWLGKAVPILEGTKKTLESKDLTKAEYKSTYVATLGALKSAYANMNKLTEAKAIGEILKKYN